MNPAQPDNSTQRKKIDCWLAGFIRWLAIYFFLGESDKLPTLKIHHGDALPMLKELESESVDACVTDPPYELGFMGKHWDSSGIAYSVELWKEVWRVLKPGAHLLAFGGTRTSHRMVCAIEDARFEIRDQLQWIYGSGFPKSLDVSKAIDKQAGVERKIIGKKGGTYETPIADIRGAQYGLSPDKRLMANDITAPATDAAKQWQGYGTALKPAHEPICLARKPLSESTVASNVLKYGTGAINVDDCRIGEGGQAKWEQPRGAGFNGGFVDYGICSETENTQGRWPANVILDEEAASLLDEQSGELSSGQLLTHHRRNGKAPIGTFEIRDRTGEPCNFGGDSGGASRFFYTAKASSSERHAGLEHPGVQFKQNSTLRHVENTLTKGNNHPTVKPVSLMCWLVRLVTPPDGVVLDPFCGSGTTGIAALRYGFNFIGIECESEYVEIARRRILNDNPLFNTEL